MNKIKQLFPAADVDAQDVASVLTQWQFRILQTSLLLASLFGLVLSFFTLGQARMSGNMGFEISYLVFTVCAILLFVLRKIPYRIRSITALVLFFLFTNIVFIHNGWSGLPLLLLVNYAVVSSALLEKKTAVTFLVIAALALFGWSYFTYTQEIETIRAMSVQALVIEIILALLSGYLISLAIGSARSRTLQKFVQYTDTKTQIDQLEEKLSIGKKEIDDSLARLRTAAEIPQVTASTSDPQQIIKRTADLLQQSFDLYYAGVFLIDQSGEYAVLHYGTGEAGRRMLTSSYRLAVAGYSLIGKAIQNKQTKMTYLNDPDSVAFENPFLPESRSELAIPISRNGEVFGALNIHSTNADKFDENNRLLFQEAADMLALVLEKNTVKQPLTTNKAQAAPVFASRSAQAEHHEMEFSYENPLVSKIKTGTSKVQVPLMLRDELIGSIDLEIEGGELSKDQAEFMQTISAQTAIALENASLLEQTLQRADRERKVLEITSKIRSTNDSQQMLQIALEELSKTLGVSKAQIVLNVPEKPMKDAPSETNTMTLTRKRSTGELHES